MRAFILLSALLMSVFSANIDAHKMKTAFTIILFNERTQNLEVMHRFYLHDAEEAVWEIFDAKADIIGSEQTQAMFSQYVVNRFSIKNQDNKVLPLETLGFQNDGGYFWVYQEIPIPANLTAISIKNDSLRDVWSEQVNIVNVEGIGEVTTIQFSDSDTWKQVQLIK